MEFSTYIILNITEISYDLRIRERLSRNFPNGIFHESTSMKKPFDQAGLGVSRSHSMASFRLFGYHIARRWNAIIGRRHVFIVGRYIFVLHLQITLYSNSFFLKLLYYFKVSIILGYIIFILLLIFILLSNFIYFRLVYTRL